MWKRSRNRRRWKSMGMKNKQTGSNPSFSTLPLWASLLIIISVAAILCVPKEITMIQQEVSHLSFPPCWPECINPAAVRMAAFVFIQFYAHHQRLLLTFCLPPHDWILHFDSEFKWQSSRTVASSALKMHYNSLWFGSNTKESWFGNRKGFHKTFMACKQSICRLCNLSFLRGMTVFIVFAVVCAQAVQFTD